MYSILPMITFLFMLISSVAVTAFLKGKTGKKGVNLIQALILLPAIPLFWMMFNENNAPDNALWTLYIPLALSVIYSLMLVIRIYDVTGK